MIRFENKPPRVDQEQAIKIGTQEIGWIVRREEPGRPVAFHVGLFIEIGHGEFPTLIQGWGSTPEEAIINCISRAEIYSSRLQIGLELLKADLNQEGVPC